MHGCKADAGEPAVQEPIHRRKTERRTIALPSRLPLQLGGRPSGSAIQAHKGPPPAAHPSKPISRYRILTQIAGSVSDEQRCIPALLTRRPLMGPGSHSSHHGGMWNKGRHTRLECEGPCVPPHAQDHRRGASRTTPLPPGGRDCMTGSVAGACAEPVIPVQSSRRPTHMTQKSRSCNPCRLPTCMSQPRSPGHTIPPAAPRACPSRGSGHATHSTARASRTVPDGIVGLSARLGSCA